MNHTIENGRFTTCGEITEGVKRFFTCSGTNRVKSQAKHFTSKPPPAT